MYSAGLLTTIMDSYTPQPCAALVTKLFDIKSWIAPYINEIHGHTQPHCFRFMKNDNSEVEMHYKQWSGSTWLPEDEGIKLLKVSDTCGYA